MPSMVPMAMLQALLQALCDRVHRQRLRPHAGVLPTSLLGLNLEALVSCN